MEPCCFNEEVKFARAVFAIALVIGSVGFIAIVLSQERRNTTTSIANLTIGDEANIFAVSLVFLGETQVNCDEQAQEKCKESKFFAFKINESGQPLAVVKEYKGTWIVQKNVGSFAHFENLTGTTVIFSDDEFLGVISRRGITWIKFKGVSKNLTRFEIKTVFGKS